jgi:hypothetical protein
VEAAGAGLPVLVGDGDRVGAVDLLASEIPFGQADGLPAPEVERRDDLERYELPTCSS